MANPPRQVEDRAKSPVRTEKVPGISLYPSQFHLQEIQLFVQCGIIIMEHNYKLITCVMLGY